MTKNDFFGLKLTLVGDAAGEIIGGFAAGMLDAPFVSPEFPDVEF